MNNHRFEHAHVSIFFKWQIMRQSHKRGCKVNKNEAFKISTNGGRRHHLARCHLWLSFSPPPVKVPVLSAAAPPVRGVDVWLGKTWPRSPVPPKRWRLRSCAQRRRLFPTKEPVYVLRDDTREGRRAALLHVQKEGFGREKNGRAPPTKEGTPATLIQWGGRAGSVRRGRLSCGRAHWPWPFGAATQEPAWRGEAAALHGCTALYWEAEREKMSAAGGGGASAVTVLAPNGRRVTVRVGPGTTLLQVGLAPERAKLCG